MKSIILSVQPKWCELIASGEKTIGETIEKRIEVRKTAPKEVPFKAYIYQTKKRWIYKLLPWLEKRQAKVIGEFVCDKVDAYTFSNYEAQYRINDVDLMKTCLNFPELIAYGKGKILYGWHISDLKIYDKPKELSEFKKPCVDKYQYCQGCKHGLVILSPDEEEYALYHGGHYDTFDTVCTNRITRPPESWQYVEELPNEPSETR